MPIVTHTMQENVQADGRIAYTLRMYDQEGAEYLQVGLLPANFDTAAFVALRKAEQDVQLSEDEFRAIVGL